MPVTITVLIGIALGFFSHMSSSLPGPWRWVGNFGALWLIVAFFTGRAARETRIGAITGAVVLAITSVVHYVPFRMARDGISWHSFRWPVLLWVVVGLVAGASFGALGAAHAQGVEGGSVFAVALLVAVLTGEAFVLWRTGHPRAIQISVPLELAVASVLPMALATSWGDRAKIYLYGCCFFPRPFWVCPHSWESSTAYIQGSRRLPG